MTPFEGVLGVHERGNSGYRQSSMSISTRVPPIFATQPHFLRQNRHLYGLTPYVSSVIVRSPLEFFPISISKVHKLISLALIKNQKEGK